MQFVNNIIKTWQIPFNSPCLSSVILPKVSWNRLTPSIVAVQNTKVRIEWEVLKSQKYNYSGQLNQPAFTLRIINSMLLSVELNWSLKMSNGKMLHQSWTKFHSTTVILNWKWVARKWETYRNTIITKAFSPETQWLSRYCVLL